MTQPTGAQFLESAGVMVIAVDPDGIVAYANRMARTVLECAPEEVLGTRLLTGFLSPEVQEEVREAFRRLLDGDPQPADHFETPILTRQGRERIVAWRSSLLRDEEGRITGVLSVGEDITERRRSRGTLERSERRFRSLIDATLDGYFCYEYDPPIPTDLPVAEQVRLMYGGILTECNRAYASLEGAGNPEELLGKTFRDAAQVSPGALDRPWTYFVTNGYRTPELERSVTTGDGHVRHLLVSSHGVVEDGKLVRTWGMLRDLSEVKKIEAARRETDVRFRKMFDESPIGMLIVDADYRIRHVNSKLCRMLGYEREELEDRPLPTIWHPDEAETNMARARQRRREGASGALVRTRYRTKDGRTLWVEVNVALVRGDQGDALDCLAMVVDVTQRRQAEKDLQRARADAFRSNQLRAMSEMAAGMAHGLNQSLVGIRGSAEHLSLALQRGWDLEEDKVRETLESIVEESDRMSSMIDHARTFAQGAQGAPDQEVDVNEVVQSCVDMIGPGILGQDIDLRCDLGEGISPVRGNPYALEDVVLNLLRNAEAAVRNGKGIRPPGAPRRIRIETEEDDSGDRAAILLRVADTGVGMSPEVMDQAFEPFFTTRGSEKGMGLGLTMVESTVERMGGDVEVESRVGQGTTITVRVPVHQEG